jgi:hypothetical protein
MSVVQIHHYNSISVLVALHSDAFRIVHMQVNAERRRIF